MWKKIILITLLIISLDQGTKFLMYKHPGDYKVLGNFLRFTLIKNPYGVFGIDYKIPIVPLTILGIFIILIILYKSKNIFLSLLLGGAVGNLIDRIIHNAVIDWIDIGIGNLRWPTFNIADASITIGIFLVIFKKHRI